MGHPVCSFDEKRNICVPFFIQHHCVLNIALPKKIFFSNILALCLKQNNVHKQREMWGGREVRWFRSSCQRLPSVADNLLSRDNLALGTICSYQGSTCTFWQMARLLRGQVLMDVSYIRHSYLTPRLKFRMDLTWFPRNPDNLKLLDWLERSIS